MHFNMKHLKACVLIALIFLAGFAVGAVATRVAVRHFVLRVIRDPNVMRERVEHGNGIRVSQGNFSLLFNGLILVRVVKLRRKGAPFAVLRVPRVPIPPTTGIQTPVV